jgi:hypothetical protein
LAKFYGTSKLASGEATTALVRTVILDETKPAQEIKELTEGLTLMVRFTDAAEITANTTNVMKLKIGNSGEETRVLSNRSRTFSLSVNRG